MNVVLSFQARWVGFRACVMPRKWAQTSAFKTQCYVGVRGWLDFLLCHKQLTIKFSKSIHRHTWRPGHKLQEPDPFLSIHQQNSLLENGHHQPHPPTLAWMGRAKEQPKTSINHLLYEPTLRTQWILSAPGPICGLLWQELHLPSPEWGGSKSCPAAHPPHS